MNYRLTSNATHNLLSTRSVIVTTDMLSLVFDTLKKVPKTIDNSYLLPADIGRVQPDRLFKVKRECWDTCKMHPISVIPSDKVPDKYVIQDGRHRFLVYILNGFDSIPVTFANLCVSNDSNSQK